jgi:SAM-dependent methyltransferase
VPVADLHAMLALVPQEAVRASTFVDVGAGMGRAVLVASEYPFKQIVGIELSPALFEIARENVASARGLRTQCRDIRLIRGDARRRKFPSGNLVVFLFNPFDGEALRVTLDRIVASRAARDTVYVLYHTPVHYSVLHEFVAEGIGALTDAIVARLSGAAARATP